MDHRSVLPSRPRLFSPELIRLLTRKNFTPPFSTYLTTSKKRRRWIVSSCGGISTFFLLIYLFCQTHCLAYSQIFSSSGRRAVCKDGALARIKAKRIQQGADADHCNVVE